MPKPENLRSLRRLGKREVDETERQTVIASSRPEREHALARREKISAHELRALISTDSHDAHSRAGVTKRNRSIRTRLSAHTNTIIGL